MNNIYWVEKYKTQTQMLRVIHDQINERQEEMYECEKGMKKSAEVFGTWAKQVNKLTPHLIDNNKRLNIQSATIDELISQIQVLRDQVVLLSCAVADLAPVSAKEKKEFKKKVLLGKYKKEKK
tara:strand:+ start:1120 stop:1488 length:369 start_codon:yes stop_codon:yes gene_type:complete